VFLRTILTRCTNWLNNHPVTVLAFCAVTFLVLGWRQNGINLDSATYAVIARNMAENGSWFAPHYTDFYHSAFAEHPPLVMWLTGLIFSLAGANDSTARLIGALCTLGSVLMVYLIGRSAISKPCGFIAGLVLLLTYNFMQIGNSTLLDVPMTFFGLVALYGLARMQSDSVTFPNTALLGIGLGCAWLAKGVVALPFWLGILMAVVLWHRVWFRQTRLWAGLVVALILVTAHLIGDNVMAGGHFWNHYFFIQIGRRFQGTTPEEQVVWWRFAVKYTTLYLPFVVLMPIGIYRIIKSRYRPFITALLVFAVYFVMYSGAAKLYYHYFCPMYALSALIVAAALCHWLKPQLIRHLIAAIPVAWLLVAAGVTIAGVRIHYVRAPELYHLTSTMNQFLADKPDRYGLMIDGGEPDWEYVANTAWYWHSDILKVNSIEQAVDSILSGHFAYVLVKNQDTDVLHTLSNQVEAVHVLARNDRVTVFAPKSSRT
jgi:4-amino-4-deoxy-L-arabinose transferase-like glycosyltransferase